MADESSRSGIPESREVYEHGNRVFDRLDERYSRIVIFLMGVAAGAVLVGLLVVTS